MANSRIFMAWVQRTKEALASRGFSQGEVNTAIETLTQGFDPSKASQYTTSTDDSDNESLRAELHQFEEQNEKLRSMNHWQRGQIQRFEIQLRQTQAQLSRAMDLVEENQRRERARKAANSSKVWR